MKTLLADHTLTWDAKRELITRVADSDLFRRAPRQREFLLYVARCTFEERLEGVREQAIAEHVFNRTPEQYDGDTIVRAEARNLRKRLEKYFDTDGAEEAFVVTMPKGGYSIAFRPRHSEPSEVHEEPDPVPEEVFTEPPPAVPVHTSGARSRVWLIALAVALCAAGLWIVKWRTKAPQPVNAPAEVLPFSSLFITTRDTLIVTSDTAFLQIGALAHRRLSLDDYLVRSYPDVPKLSPADLIQSLNRSQYTDADETGIAASIMREHAGQIGRTYLRSGRQVTLADFKMSNIILLGSPISNPWAQLYAKHVTFQFDQKEGGWITLQNTAPKPGERAVYPAPEDAGQNRTYAQLVFIPGNFGGDPSVLLVAGTTAEATQAAGEFLLDPGRLGGTLRRIGIDPVGKPHYFELLLRATTFIGGATEAELAAYRLAPPGTNPR